MEKNLTTLQDLINERAEKKLDNDLIEIARFIGSKDILSTNKVTLQYKLKPDDEPSKDLYLHNIFNYQRDYGSQYIRSSTFMEALKEIHLPTYIHRETKEFLEKFDEMTSTVQDLKNESDY